MTRKIPTQKQYLRALRNHIISLEVRMISCPIEEHKTVEAELIRARKELKEAENG